MLFKQTNEDPTVEFYVGRPSFVPEFIKRGCFIIILCAFQFLLIVSLLLHM